MKTQHTPTYEVHRDQGYGRCYSRIGFKSYVEAETAMQKWQREGFKNPQDRPSLIGGGIWEVREATAQ